MSDWITDRLPSKEDADSFGQVLWTHPGLMESWGSVRPGEPWRHTSSWKAPPDEAPKPKPAHLHCPFDLNELVSIFAQAACPQSNPYYVSDGLIAVLSHLTDNARRAIAHTPERYDHRSLYEFCASLDYVLRANDQTNANS
jgi:hypothetical protein